MIETFDEGIKHENNKPLPVQCLVNRSADIPSKGWHNVHYHEYIELLYADSGDFEVYINGKVETMPEGSMVIINAREAHTVRGLTFDRTHTCVKFIPQILFSSEQTVTELEYSIPYVFESFGHIRSFSKELIEDTPIPAAFSTIKSENSAKKFGYELVIRAEVLKIFSWIIRYWHDSTDSAVLHEPSDREISIIRKARDYIDKNYDEVTLTSCSAECGLSYSYFSRVFNDCVGMKFKDYVNLTRVNRSINLLVDTEMSITDIAVLVGFTSESYYIHVFKKIKNISPYKFRQLIKNNKSIK